MQFEDFQSKWAFKLLQRYRNTYRMFNDDVQVIKFLVISKHLIIFTHSNIHLHKFNLSQPLMSHIHLHKFNLSQPFMIMTTFLLLNVLSFADKTCYEY